MTERMAKEYALNDAQKKQLLEANLALVEKMRDMPKHRKPKMKRGERNCNSCCCEKADKCHKENSLTDEQCAQKKAEMEKKRKEMQDARSAYDVKLQKIMTKEQYAAYTQKFKERKEQPRRDRR